MTLLSGKAKLEEVTRIIGLLREDAKDGNLAENGSQNILFLALRDGNYLKIINAERNTLLQELKVYGREKLNADPIFTKEGIETLSRQGFDSTSLQTSREALRCLANALLLDGKTRQIFADLGYGAKAAERLKNEDTDDEFLMSRLLFLTTYDTDLDFDDLFEKHQLGDSISQHISRHSKQFSGGGKEFQLPPAEEQALSETLKLIFNLTNFYPHRTEAFGPSIPAILKILSLVKIPTPPLQGLVSYLINSLLNLDLEVKDSKALGENTLFPEFNQKINTDRLINILDKTVTMSSPAQLENVAIPTLTVLRKLYELAPEDPKKHMRLLLLPEEGDRDLPVGQDDALSSRLLRLSLAPDAPNLREAISSLMFELSGKNASDFVKNVGYGYAAGFLMTHGIAIPKNVKEAHSRPDGKSPLNPITGQRLDAEPQDTGPEMTEEEKEREAERLFVLFERLRATGVVQVTNPVEAARDEGRFEEIE